MYRKNLTVILLLLFCRSAAGYGEMADTLLNWQERTVTVLTNACRMAPVAFRDRFIDNDGILLPENYPPVAPVYWNRELNAASRFHAVEMALVCGMTHTSCNGESWNVRLRQFYTKAGGIAENIAAGYSSPLDAVCGWIIDGRTAQTAAADKSDADGHRANIMAPGYTETGCGFAVTGSGGSATAYWCQDFGSGKSSYTYHPVYGASHLFFNSTTITFMANLYDPSKEAETLTLLLEGDRLPLELAMGTTSAGTWEVSVPAASSCRTYAVEAEYNDGHTLLYPEEGRLITVGEGFCREDDTIAEVAIRRSGLHSVGLWITMKPFPGGLRLSSFPGIAVPIRTELVDCRGRVLWSFVWSSPSERVVPSRALTSGLRLIRHRFADGTLSVCHWISY